MLAETHLATASLADEKGRVVDVALEDDLLAPRGDALGAREGGDGPHERAEELHRDEDGGDDELRLGADVGRPPRRLRRRLEDARDAVRLGQEGAVHGAEAHPHREPAVRAERLCYVASIYDVRREGGRGQKMQQMCGQTV